MENREKLAECEEIIMSILWSAEEDLDLMTVRNKAEEKFGKEWKLQTVATFMTRIAKKGYISIYRIGRYSHYHPEVSMDEYRLIKLKEVNMVLFGGDIGAMQEFVSNMGGRDGTNSERNFRTEQDEA